MDAIVEIAAAHGLAVIEDAAHALPARWRGQTVGTIGDLTCFSFYATKTITTGEGGMITTEDPEWADRMRIMSLHGISKDAWKRYTAEGSWRYEIIAPGYKYNMTDIAAALGISQLARCDDFLRARLRCKRLYDEGFAGQPAIQTPVAPMDIDHAWHLYVIRVDPAAVAHRSRPGDSAAQGPQHRGRGSLYSAPSASVLPRYLWLCGG